MFDSFRFYDLEKKEYSKDIEIEFKNGILTFSTDGSNIIIENYISPITKPKYCYTYENDLIKIKDNIFIVSKSKDGLAKLKAANFGSGSVTFGIDYLRESENTGKSHLIGSIWENLDMLDKLPKSEQKRIKRMLKEHLAHD